MALYLALTYFTIISLTRVSGDFFSDLDKLDIDSKLREIDKAIKDIDKGDNQVKKSKPKPEDDSPDLGSAVEMLAGMFGGGECKYQCKNGNKPVPKLEHVPTSNGCGSSGIKVDTDDIPGMEDCCHDHDYCYDTCNSDRTTCDKDFKKCLHDVCNNMKSLKSKTKISHKDCKSTADLMYGGTVALGCDPFLQAQENACHCRKTLQTESDKSNGNRDARKKSASDSAKSSKKGRNSSGRRSDEL